MPNNIDLELSTENYQLATVEGLTVFLKEKHSDPKAYGEFQVRLASASRDSSVITRDGLVTARKYIRDLLGGDEQLLDEYFEWFVSREDQKQLLLQAYNAHYASLT